MNKMEYMKQLNNQLLDINEEDRKEILADFEQHFEQGMQKKKLPTL